MNTRDIFNTPYDEAVKNKFTLAKNSHYDNLIINKYRGFTSYLELENFLTTIQKMNQKVYFEIIKEECKFYFDLDHINFLRSEFYNYINEFIKAFNIYFQTSISIDNLLIYYRDDKNNIDKITSVHISIMDYKTNKKTIKNFLQYYSNHIDVKIYTRNRLFNLPFNTKMKYLFKDENNPLLFNDYKPQSRNPKDYLVSYTDHIKDKIQIPFYNLLSTKIIECDRINTKSILRNAFNILKQNNKKNESTEVIKNYYNSLDEAVEFLIETLPNKFFTNSNDWKLVTNILKKYGISIDNVGKWNKASEIKSLEQWDKQTNETYFKNIDVSKIKSGLPMFNKVIQKYINYEILLEVNKDLILWIKDKLTINDDTVNDIIRNNINLPIIEISVHWNIFYYDTKSGFLKNSNKHTLGNFYTEVELKKIFYGNKNNNEIELNHIDEIEPYVNNFNLQDTGILSIKAPWGTGKTNKIIRAIIVDANKKGNRIIMISENNALNLKLSKDFNFLTHIDNNKLDQNKNIVCSSESIQKVIFRDTDIIILDEYETLLNHYSSDTFKHQEFNKFLLFKQGLIKSNKIIILDADLSIERIAFLKQLKQTEFITYNIKQNNFKEYSFFVYETKNTMFKQINTVIKTNKKIVIASSTKSQIDNFYMNFKNDIMKQKIDNKTILKVTSDGVCLFKNNINQILDKTESLNNLESIIIDNQVDIFLYTPTIKTGISINATYFDKCYGYAYNKSVCSREFIQMLFRARNLKDKEIHIAFNTRFSKPRPYITKSHIQNILINPVSLFKTLKLFLQDNDFNNININDDDINYDKDYLIMKISNIYETYNSQTRFTQDLMTRLLYNHNLQIKFIDDDPDMDLEDEYEDDEIKSEDEFVKTKLITREEFNRKLTNENYDKIQKIEDKIRLIEYENHTDIQDNTDFYNDIIKPEIDKLKEDIKEIYEKGIDWREKKKFMLFYRHYYIKGITNNYEQNTNLYEMLNNVDFYYIFTNRDIQNQYNLNKQILNQTIQTLFEKNQIEAETNNVNSLNNYESKIGEQIIILDIIKELGLNISQLPNYKTNEIYDSIINNFNFNEFNKKLENYYKNYVIEHYHNFDFKNKNYKKNIKAVLNELLLKIGIHCKYINRHKTTGKTDKLMFYYKDFNCERPLYQGRLTENDIRTDSAIKTRNTYKTETGIKLYKNGTTKIYYTTYQAIYNKKLQYLMNAKTDKKTDYKDLMDYTINTELKKYIIQKNRPFIIEQEKLLELIETVSNQA